MPDKVNVRKAYAGADSAGHTWPADGAVIEVPVEHALLLARIPDGGFTIVEQPDRDGGMASSGSESSEETQPRSGRRARPE